MKGIFKKTLSMVLCFVMVFTMFQGTMLSASAKVVGPDNKTELTITTDKSKYSWGDTIVFNITVKNVTNETLTGIKINSFARAYTKVAQQGDLPVIARLAPGESETVQIEYYTTRLVGVMAIFFPIIWFFNPVARIAYREAHFNYEQKVKVGAFRYRVGFEVIYNQEVQSSDFKLTASEHEIETSSKSTTVYFYAQPPEEFSTIELYDSSKQEAIAVMLDNGAFSSNGDDIPNDGIFSSKIDINSTTEVTKDFYAVAKNQDGESVTSSNSCTINIYIYSPLEDSDIEQMDTVDDTLSDLMSSDKYIVATDAQKKKIVENQLASLEKEGLINSVVFDSKSNVFSFIYANGAYGGVSLYPFNEEQNGQSRSDISNQELNLLKVTNSTTNGAFSIGDALVLHSFGNSVFRTTFYNNTKTDWENHGLNTTIDKSVTVSDLKSIDSKYEVICISGHGSFYRNQPVICLEETVTDENRKIYSADIKKARIASVTTTSGTEWWAFSKLFEDHYNEDSFANSFFFAECCCFFGEGSTHTNTFADTLISIGARAVIGFHNSVKAVYCRELMKDYIDGLLTGKTAGKSYDEAVSENGTTDGQTPDPATPNFRGDRAAKLVETGIKNGSFEEAKTPVFWNSDGDVRIISKLSELNPNHGSEMAILTTGIGAAESKYLEGTEGSILSQTFVVPKGTKSISFNYDVVSEEPMEFVGSKYDDKFSAELIDQNGKIVATLSKETINTSTWYSIDGIDFEDGDSTTYHTQWKNVSSTEISKYENQVITLRFRIWDVGDSVYDTAALVDNIVLK